MIKIAAMVGAPDLHQETLAVFSGDLETAFSRLRQLGYDGVELMTRDPDRLDGESIRRSLDSNHLKLAGLCSGHVYGEDGLGLVGPDPEICRQAMERLMRFVDFAAGFGTGTLVNIGRSRGRGLPKIGRVPWKRWPRLSDRWRNMPRLPVCAWCWNRSTSCKPALFIPARTASRWCNG